MLSASKSELPHVEQADSLSTALRITGIYHEPSMNRDIPWKIHRTWPGLFSFIIIGFMAEMFGLGAGWANVPVLNRPVFSHGLEIGLFEDVHEEGLPVAPHVAAIRDPQAVVTRPIRAQCHRDVLPIRLTVLPRAHIIP